ncbi:MAG TPA: NAD(P)-dependent oxidoreductase [Steroidobacteraceae bacterium]
MDVGFIGLGQMGAAMAACLLRGGHRVTVHNRTAARAQPLIAQGARAAGSVAEACRGDAVFTMLADDLALESTSFGPGGVLASLARNCIHVSSSTISVELAERLARAHAESGGIFVAAPVFGRPEAAAAGKLFVVAAGERAALERLGPLFSAIGQRTFVVADQPPLANLVKLSGNFLIGAVIEILGEAMALTGKAGIDGHAYLEILSATLFGAPVVRTYGALIAARKFEPAGFTVPLGLKDIQLALRAGQDLSVPLPVAALLRDRLLSLVAHGRGHLDWSAAGALAAADAGAPYP